MAKHTNTNAASIVDSIVRKAEAAETSKVLLGSSGNGGLDVFDAAIAQIDLHLARLQAAAAKDNNKIGATYLWT